MLHHLNFNNPRVENILRHVFAFLITLLFMLSASSCKDEGVVEPEPLGDYLFVERTIITDATLLRGDPGWIPVVVIEPSIRYTFDSQTRTLSYRAGENTRLPINKDLRLIFADAHYFLLPHVLSERGVVKRDQGYSRANPVADTVREVTTGALFWLTPMFFFPHFVDASMYVLGIGNDGIVGVQMVDSTMAIGIRRDSSFVRVTTRIDSVFQLDGNWAIFEFKDSLTIKNYGFQPKQNVIWNPMGE